MSHELHRLSSIPASSMPPPPLGHGGDDDEALLVSPASPTSIPWVQRLAAPAAVSMSSQRKRIAARLTRSNEYHQLGNDDRHHEEEGEEETRQGLGLRPLTAVAADDFVDVGHHAHHPHRPQTEKHVVDESPTRAQSAWQWMKEACVYGWVPETFHIALAVASLAAIFAVLRTHDGDHLPEWPMGITINALVAMLSVTLKAGFSLPLADGLSQLKWQWFTPTPEKGCTRKLIDLEEFDAASRGIWGSFLFVFRRGMGTLHWFAKLAAFLTILGFAIDPFIQQIVQYVPCQREVAPPQMGNITRTNNAVFHANPDNPYLKSDPYMQLSINNALTNPRPSNKNNADSILFNNCPTGNCTFPPFSTTAVCHVCKNATDRIVRAETRPEHWDLNHYNYSLPAGPFSIPRLTVGERGVLRVKGPEYPDEAPLFAMNMLAVPAQGEPDDWDFFGDPVAFACWMWPCVRTLQASITNSTFREEELSRVAIGYNHAGTLLDPTAPLRKQVNISYIYASTSVGNGSVIVPEGPEGGAAEPCTSFPERAPGLVEVPVANINAAPVKLSDDGPPPPGTVWMPEHCVWYFDKVVSESITKELYHQLSDLEITDGVSYSGSGKSRQSPSLTATRLWATNGRVSYKTANRAMADVTDSITAVLRNRGKPTNGTKNDRVWGPAYRQATCLQVDWAWFLYPLIMVVLATLWLVAMIWQSPRGEVSKRGWKSSSLAVLLAGVDGEQLYHAAAQSEKRGRYSFSRGMQIYSQMSRARMEDIASLIDVQLENAEDGKAIFTSKYVKTRT